MSCRGVAWRSLTVWPILQPHTQLSSYFSCFSCFSYVAALNPPHPRLTVWPVLQPHPQLHERAITHTVARCHELLGVRLAAGQRTDLRADGNDGLQRGLGFGLPVAINPLGWALLRASARI